MADARPSGVKDALKNSLRRGRMGKRTVELLVEMIHSIVIHSSYPQHSVNIVLQMDCALGIRRLTFEHSHDPDLDE
jgi:hypothetical protein